MYYIGIDIGGTKCAASLGFSVQAGEIKILCREEFKTEGAPSAVLEKIAVICRRFLSEHEDEVFGGIGISCGGPLDAKRGIIMSPPNLPGWDDVHVTEFFEERFSLPAKLQNDANACVVAEWLFGAGQGFDNVIFLTFGTGLGAGLILDGKLYSGSCDSAGEIGHVRLRPDGPVGFGKAGSCEGFCSGGGLAQMGRVVASKTENSALLKKAGRIENINAKLICDLAREGDADCLEIMKECGERLGETLSILIDLLNPQRIILGGIFMRAADLIEPHMMAVMKWECLPEALSVCRIVPAGLGENIGDYAALALAVQTSINQREESDMKDSVNLIFEELFERYPALEVCRQEIARAYERICETYQRGGTIFTCGNGGSCSDSEHIVGELLKSFKFKRKIDEKTGTALRALGDEGRELADALEGALSAVALTSHPALNTAFLNDTEPQMTFAQQLMGLGRKGDLLIVISTSGNSKNCVYATTVARAKGISTIAMTGQRESRLSEISDVTIKVPEVETYRVQELHLPVYHALCAMVEETFFDK